MLYVFERGDVFKPHGMVHPAGRRLMRWIPEAPFEANEQLREQSGQNRGETRQHELPA